MSSSAAEVYAALRLEFMRMDLPSMDAMLDAVDNDERTGYEDTLYWANRCMTMIDCAEQAEERAEELRSALVEVLVHCVDGLFRDRVPDREKDPTARSVRDEAWKVAGRDPQEMADPQRLY